MELQQATVILLILLVAAAIWLGIELRRLNAGLQPVLSSGIVQGLSAL